MNNDFKNYIQLLIDNKDKITHLPERDIHNLLDYITNLQQENERLKENNMSYQEEMARTWKIADDYKLRIEKAVEYIEEKNYGDEYSNFWVACGEDCACPYEAIERLLNILNGRSDE